MTNFKEDILNIKALVFDCDGVLTDGGVTTLPNGEALRIYNVKDGFAIAMAIKQGFKVAIISGGVGEAMVARFKRLNIEDVYLGCSDKITALNSFIKKHNISMNEVLYMGDDMPDIEPMLSVGIACAPKDAAPEVKEAAKYVSNYCGGKGCVRDVVEQVLKSQDKWFEVGDDKSVLSI